MKDNSNTANNLGQSLRAGLSCYRMKPVPVFTLSGFNPYCGGGGG